MIVSVVGARPQFIKLAPLAPVLSRKLEHEVIHTGQHYDYEMSQIFFKQLRLPTPKFNLNVGSGSHAFMTGKIMMKLEKLLERLKPDLVLVYGDTNSTLAGALTAAKLQIPVGHIEAGLRSGRFDMPEEINRCLTDQISALLFCPTMTAIRNLKKEGIEGEIIHSGDLMFELIAGQPANIQNSNAILKKYGLDARRYILTTIHRASNSDLMENLKAVVAILTSLKERVIFPVHPRTASNLRRFGLWKRLKTIENLTVTEPLSYLDNLSLIKNARAVMTDSGGVQKEAAFLGTPCLTLRDETEWPETLRNGNMLVGLSSRKIKHNLKHLRIRWRETEFKVKGELPSAIIDRSVQNFLGVS